MDDVAHWPVVTSGGDAGKYAHIFNFSYCSGLRILSSYGSNRDVANEIATFGFNRKNVPKDATGIINGNGKLWYVRNKWIWTDGCILSSQIAGVCPSLVWLEIHWWRFCDYRVICHRWNRCLLGISCEDRPFVLMIKYSSDVFVSKVLYPPFHAMGCSMTPLLRETIKLLPPSSGISLMQSKCSLFLIEHFICLAYSWSLMTVYCKDYSSTII